MFLSIKITATPPSGLSFCFTLEKGIQGIVVFEVKAQGGAGESGKEEDRFGRGIFTELRDHGGFPFPEGLKIKLRGGLEMGTG